MGHEKQNESEQCSYLCKVDVSNSITYLIQCLCLSGVVSCALKNGHQNLKIKDQKDQKLVWPTLIGIY